jgi:hypothetical protein
MLYGRLKRVGATELRIYDNEADGPVNDSCETNQEYGACDKASVLKCVGLSNDTGAAARVSICPQCRITCSLT